MLDADIERKEKGGLGVPNLGLFARAGVAVTERVETQEAITQSRTHRPSCAPAHKCWSGNTGTAGHQCAIASGVAKEKISALPRTTDDKPRA